MSDVDDKVRTIYVRVFHEHFSATSLQPIPDDDFRNALDFSLKGILDEDEIAHLCKMFDEFDIEKEGELSI
jgi:hypothetical protein